MQKAREIYMEQQNRRMPRGCGALYFVIDEKLNGVELTDKGVELISGTQKDPQFFVMPDIASQLSELETQTGLHRRISLQKDGAYQFAVKVNVFIL